VIDLPNADPRGSEAKAPSDTPPVAFGPVPSRRLGRSLGINNIPPKTCSYSCTYCQLGRTTRMVSERAEFHAPKEILRGVRKRVREAEQAGESIDYLTFVADGEPTLDVRLGEAIDLLRSLGWPIAVISNASLLWRADVRGDLAGADWVSLKVDAADETTWRTLNRPHRSLRFGRIQDGLLEFAEGFGGRLVSETMLVGGVNDDERHVDGIAALVGRLKPAVAYVAAPTRPPAEPWVDLPRMDVIVGAHQSFGERAKRVELLIGYEGNEFTSSGGLEETLLGTTAVHPMREEAVDELLMRTGGNRSVVRRLVQEGRLVRLDHGGHTFYVRGLPGR